MKTTKNFVTKKLELATITLILTLTFAATFVALPIVSAHDPPLNIETAAYLTVAPNPIGVGQPAAVMFWLDKVMPTAMGAYGDRWHGLTIEVTKPDGTTQTLGPFTSDPIGAGWYLYTPDQLGTYYFQFSFPGETLAGENPNPGGSRGGEAYIGDFFEASTSKKVELTVQQEPIEPWPETPLPEDYWERPINYENRDWWQISGNWLTGHSNLERSAGSFNPYTRAPNTAHIVWTKEGWFGGIIGGEYGTISYYTGMTYEDKWGGMYGGPIIMNGRLYRNILNPPRYGFECIDLRTGEQIWWQNSTQQKESYGGFHNWMYPGLTCGQILDMETPNQHGGIPYLWSITTSKYAMYDAFTGNWILDIENVSAGTTAFGPHGELIVYILNSQGNWLAMWNSTKCIPMAGTTSTEAWQWRPPLGATLDWQEGIEWNVTVPNVPAGARIRKIGDGVIIAAATVQTDVYPQVTADLGFDAKTGEQLWAQNRTDYTGTRLATGPLLDGVYTIYDYQALHWYGYDINTGNQLWGPNEPLVSSAWDMYQHSGFVAAWGKLFAVDYGGVHAFDIKDGTPLWSYSSGISGLETPYGSWPFWWFGAAADGKLYVPTGEHSPSMPLYKGEQLHCINADTGERVWSIKGWFQGPAIADGYLVAYNHGDNRIYSFGKGQTATTVTAEPAVIADGSSVLIKGTVMDQSPGAEGTPAIADEDMTEWMEYLYMQQPMPMEATGVKVTLDAIDPNSNFISIGETTSNIAGDYGFMWTPEHEGKYEIIATFEGSESYWSSYDTTFVGVDPAPSAAGPIEPEPTEPSEAPFITTELAIIVAAIVVAVIGIVAYWALRKRK